MGTLFFSLSLAHSILVVLYTCLVWPGCFHSLALGVGLRGAHVLEVVVVLGLDVRAMKDHILKLHNHLIMVGVRFYPDIGIVVGPVWVR